MKQEINQPDLIASSGDSLREAFGKSLVKFAKKYPNFVVLDADVAGGTGTYHFQKDFPERFFQFGISEQNMMAAAAGMASCDLIPFVTTFSVFSLRAIEQARLSIAYSKSNVKIVASHPGLDVGPDGASAQCLEDLSIYRAIPDIVVLSPCDPLEIEQATEEIIKYKGPVYMRTGRSDTKRILSNDYKFKIGKGSILRDGKDVTIFSCGVETRRALEAYEILKKKNIYARVVNLSSIKPIDKELIIQCAKDTGCFVTAEDHNILGGLGGAVAEITAQTLPVPIEFIGVNDCFGESGEPEELSEKYGLTSPFIVDAVIKVISRKTS